MSNAISKLPGTGPQNERICPVLLLLMLVGVVVDILTANTISFDFVSAVKKAGLLQFATTIRFRNVLGTLSLRPADLRVKFSP